MQTISALRDTIPSSAVIGLDGEAIRRDYEESGAWGLLSSIDLHECDGDTIRDAEAIKRFVLELCERIDMKRFGETVVVNFGEDEKVAGYSMTQLIETSLISGHFANLTNATYLDIFSCKYYNPAEVAEFAKEFFGASDYTMTYTLRK
ncbi:MAG: S-adenosylmethionine decarboxylase [Patescibacteria group bacterium]|nr:S-adenosylmethionine decarboxylase [Patescibacteria group bacterium]